MTVTDSDVDTDRPRLSLGTAAARNLATTTKSVPQMQGITSRWLLKVLPWVQAAGGAYRVNRRLSYAVGDGRLTFTNTGAEVQVIPLELTELPLLRGYDDVEALAALAGRFRQVEYGPGDVIVETGGAQDQVFLIAHGKVNKIGQSEYGDQTVLDVLANGDYFGDQVLAGPQAEWDYTVKAVTPVIALTLSWQDFETLNGNAGGLRAHIQHQLAGGAQRQNAHGEAEIDIASGHDGEPALPGTFVDYELAPRELELSVAQTVLKVHSRVADLYNQPMDQVEQQLRLTIEALRERQEYEMVNNRQFGLLHNADLKHRIHTRTGPPTPDDLDELLGVVWKEPTAFLAHPRVIAAIGREFNKRGIYPSSVDLGGHQVPAWRGVPILPCGKIGISKTRTSSIMLLRAGEQNQGVIGLHQTGLPDEYQPGLSVRFMGIDDKAIISYLVSAYYSAAILVPDALGVLEHVEIGRED
ncbi:family 2B encapsulin nanocompartment shell protein [Actinosynnema sp. NPDC047251]|uniref:Transcriptional regulator n=1 Tax=Saccharothrix espanaensis (strain ATCC 51144 / DSM 44229 / JCM 9112 / NBRC 15066 / NRRL 15764) TaxID=1179773 RepID=K0K4V3_SACES|nr:family 2B encapsulin nanocompartment shell protein [Saccharothrix espanaensis]CCH33331.1 Transcriptional regulator [Saccharothrix espanaensis DSM 44229]